MDPSATRNARLLLSGFEPFDGESLNPSAVVVQALSRDPPHGVELEAVVLPVACGPATRLLLERLADFRPDAVLALGEAGGRACVTPERVAINVDDFRIPDHAGRQPRGEPVLEGGPVGYLSTLPVAGIVTRLTEAGIPAEISNSAGTYVCNHVFYRLMHHLQERDATVPAGFMHLPYLDEQVADRSLPGLPLTMLVRAVAVAIDTLLAPRP